MLSTTKECFEFIAKNWTKEMYKKEKERYKKICSRILSNETETSISCYRCKTIWDNKNMVSNWYGCSHCDTSAQPCLSNPINKEYVLKYIPKQHHRYLLSTINVYGVEMIKCNSGKVICTLKHSYPYDGDDKDDYVYMGEYDGTISQEPIDICTINDKIKDNIILESNNIALSDITLTLSIISRQEIILTLSETISTNAVPFSINPHNLHDLALYYCH
jgi:hypothetical protein